MYKFIILIILLYTKSICSQSINSFDLKKIIRSGDANVTSYADRSIYRNVDFIQFQFKSKTQKDSLLKYNLPISKSDTLIYYDWDLGNVHNIGKPVYGKIVIRDSLLKILRFNLYKQDKKYVYKVFERKFKIVEINSELLTLKDLDNIAFTYYFGRKKILKK